MRQYLHLLFVLLLVLPSNVFCHTVALCIANDPCGQTGVFAGTYHTFDEVGLSGGMLVRPSGSSGPFTRYNFQSHVDVEVDTIPPGVSLSSCSFPCPRSGIVMWQYVQFSSLTPGLYELTTTCDTDVECPWDTCLNSVIQVNPVPTNMPPSISCPGPISVGTDSNVCGAYPTFSVSGSDDCFGGASVSTSVPSGSFFSAGTTVVTGTATDPLGLTTSCSFNVQVTDTVNPTASCSPQTINLNTNTATASAFTATSSSTDNCAITTRSLSQTTFTCSNLGPNTVTATVGDASGRTSSCSASVLVRDLINPVASCSSQTIVLSTTSATASALTATSTSTDNCAITTRSLSKTTFTCANLGSNTVTATVADSSTNSATCLATVIVEDRTDPSVTCPANQVVVALPGLCSAYVTYPLGTASDNCAIASTSFNPLSGSLFQTGSVLASFSATDTSGNVGFCSFTVTVIDNQNPVIRCPDMTVGTDAGRCDAVVFFQVFATDNCDIASITYSIPNGSRLGLGTRTVSSTATDLSGNQASCTFSVTVIDTEAPRVTCPSDIRLNAANSNCMATATYSPSAIDNCDPSPVLTLSPASGSNFPVGNSIVTFMAVDNRGLFGVCDFTVTVVDTQPPVITCPSAITVNARECSAIVNFSPVSADDNCGASNTIVISNPASGFNFPVGTTTVTSTIIDAAGLTSTCSFPVNVLDPSNECLCGNGRIDSGEQCEINQMGSATCASRGFADGGVLDCTRCQYDTSRCAVCGDGRLDGVETCDGANLNDQTCVSLGFTAGQLRCTGGCRLDTSGCTSCGDGAIQGTEQCDGSNLDGKTCSTVMGVQSSGTLSCTTECQFNTALCKVPVVTMPISTTVIAHQIAGIRVKATGFSADQKVTVTLSDGVLSKVYYNVALALPVGSIDATFQAPTTLKPSSNWVVSVKGQSSLYVASSPKFVVLAV